MIKEGGERLLFMLMKCACVKLQKQQKWAISIIYHYTFYQSLKNAQKLNEIGIRLAKEYGIAYLMSDFKKKNGYKRSVELSAEHHLYRQDYCGCVFSKREAKLRDSINLTSPLRCNKILIIRSGEKPGSGV